MTSITGFFAIIAFLPEREYQDKNIAVPEIDKICKSKLIAWG
jgi:hypothetical protein